MGMTIEERVINLMIEKMVLTGNSSPPHPPNRHTLSSSLSLSLYYLLFPCVAIFLHHK